MSVAHAARVLPHRHPLLFVEFLRRGYKMMRLSSANPRCEEAAMAAKLALGCAITAIDDLADNPERHDPAALARATNLLMSSGRLSGTLSDFDELLVALRDEMLASIRQLPGYQTFGKLFNFDWIQIINANSFHQILTTLPTLANQVEMHHYGAFNMGMVAAHMIDLMSIPEYPLDALGSDRQVFHWGQRHGRISNMLFTEARETAEGDVTSELLSYGSSRVMRNDLLAEQDALLARIAAASGISFGAEAYIQSLLSFRDLHSELSAYL